jgi:TetR/AcrR family transcriptional regulator, transcriptional repressor of aconitase
MPKISDERRIERREQILEGARRAFSEHGYEGATVVRLEEATGLSRGAIFNYFPSKEDLFIELAVRDSAEMSEIWMRGGLDAVVRGVLELDPAWLGVYLELVRRVRTDPEFRRKVEQRQEAVIPVQRARERLHEAQEAGELRDDVDALAIGAFVNLVLNGLALQRASGDAPPPVEVVVRLLEDAIADPARSGTRPRTPA